MNQGSRQSLFDLPSRYRIRVLGPLSADLASRLADMTITLRHAANRQQVTTLIGEVRDQAALMGVLTMLYDMGFPLLKLERLGPPSSAEGPSRQGEAIKS
jgi:hypothetical protein